MVQMPQELYRAPTLTTRRGMIACNIKVIGAVAAAAVLASLGTPAEARTPCFLRGTKIRTVLGERSVEDLAVGDLLPAAFGGARSIQWITRYRHTKDDLGKRWRKSARPVRIMRSALAPDIPHSDLYVTPGHALFIDGLLVPAGTLINGTTIELYAADEYDELEFFQVKLETHDVIYAQGAPCETLLSVSETDRTFEEYCRKYGAPETQESHCAPVVCKGARSEIRSRLRSTMSPWLGRQKIDLIRERLDERAMTLVSADKLTSYLPKASPARVSGELSQQAEVMRW